MRPHSGANGEGDLSSTLAFSLLFVFPAISAVSLWIILRVIDWAVALGNLNFYPWLLLVLAPTIPSAAIAQWACRRSGTASSTLGASR